MSTQTCESCGMPMAGPDQHAPGHPESTWCAYCSTPTGELQDFDERFERMVQWSMRQQELDRPAAEAATRDHMRGMPAWKDHPKLA